MPGNGQDHLDGGYLTVQQVASLLQVSRDTVYRHLPCVRIGDAIRISAGALRNWIAHNTFPSAGTRARSPFARKAYQLEFSRKVKRKRKEEK